MIFDKTCKGVARDTQQNVFLLLNHSGFKLLVVSRDQMPVYAPMILKVISNLILRPAGPHREEGVLYFTV